jgi:hypothetical protein
MTARSGWGWLGVAFMVSIGCGSALESAPDRAMSDGGQPESGEASIGTSEGGASLGGAGGANGPATGGYSGEDQGSSSSGAAAVVVECNSADVLVQVDAAVVLAEGAVRATHLLSDAAGNAYVAGSFRPYAGSVDLGSGALAGAGDIFLLKLDASGEHLWSRRFGNSGDETFDGVEAFEFADNGDLLMAGYLDADAIEHSRQVFAARFDTQGSLVWEQALPAKDAWVTAILETPAGDLQVWGSFQSSWTLGGTTLVASEHSKIFLAQFSAAGDLTLAKQFGTADYEVALDVANDGGGNTYLAAHAQEVFNDGTGGPIRGLVTAFDSTLQPIWQRDLGEYTHARQLAVAEGKLLVAGDADPWVPQPNSDSVTKDPRIIIGQLELATGEPLIWRSHQFGFSYVPSAIITSLAVLPDASVVVGGVGSAHWRLGETVLRSAAESGALLARFAPNGDPLWATLLCSDQNNDSVVAVSSVLGNVRALVEHDGYLEVGSTRLTTEGSALLTLPIDQ